MDEIIAIEQAIALVQDRDYRLGIESNELIEGLRKAQSLVVNALLYEMLKENNDEGS